MDTCALAKLGLLKNLNSLQEQFLIRSRKTANKWTLVVILMVLGCLEVVCGWDGGYVSGC